MIKVCHLTHKKLKTAFYFVQEAQGFEDVLLQPHNNMLKKVLKNKFKIPKVAETALLMSIPKAIESNSWYLSAIAEELPKWTIAK